MRINTNQQDLVYQEYGGNRSEKAKIILESIEESFNHHEQVSFSKLSIEHGMIKNFVRVES